MKGYGATVILDGLTVLFSAIGSTTYMLIGVFTDEWHFGWIGIFLASTSFGAANLTAAVSGRTNERHYNTLSDKLDSISRRQDDLIALVQAQPQHSPHADPAPESPPAALPPTPPCPPRAR